MSRPRLLAVAGVVLIVIVVAVVLAVRHGSTPATAARRATTGAAGSHPAGYGTSLRSDGRTTLAAVPAAEALCSVRPQALHQLTTLAQGPTPAKPVSTRNRIENLRDGIGLLEDRMSQVQLAAAGRPLLAPVLQDLKSVHTSWQAAITAADGKKATTAAARLKTADRKIAGSLTPALAAAYPGMAGDCG